MNPAVTKIRQLVALAVDDAATPNEARNAALAACTLIARERLLERTTSPSRQLPPATATAAAPTVPPRRIVVRHPARCLDCGTLIHTGAYAVWYRGEGIRHFTCPGVM
jgi:hypothetical protein